MKSKNKNRPSKNQATNQGDQQPIINWPSSIMCLPPPPTDQERADYERKKRRDTIKFRVEIATLIVLVVYSGITILIWCTAQKSAQTARDQFFAFKNRERAILQLDATWDRPSQKLTYTLVNVGNSTAYGISVSSSGGSCAIQREGARIVELSPDFLKGIISPHSSLAGGFSLQVHDPKYPNGWTESEDAPVPTTISWTRSSCSQQTIGYQDTFGDEWCVYACMFYNPAYGGWTRCNPRPELKCSP